MEVELIEQLAAAKYRRTEFRRGYRNGYRYRYRGLLTELGPIEHIQVPRDRDGQCRTQVLPGTSVGSPESILCAYGITHAGVRELIDFRQASSESEAMWTAFLDSLYRQGLSGDTLQMVSPIQYSASVESIIFGVISHMNANWKAKPLPQFTHNC